MEDIETNDIGQSLVDEFVDDNAIEAQIECVKYYITDNNRSRCLVLQKSLSDKLMILPVIK